MQLNKDKSMTGNLKISLIMPRSYKTKSLRALRGLYYAGTLDGALFIGGGGDCKFEGKTIRFRPFLRG